MPLSLLIYGLKIVIIAAQVYINMNTFIHVTMVI